MKKIILLLLLLTSSTIALFSQTDNRLIQGLVPIEKIKAFPLPAQNTEALLAEELAKRTSGRAPKYAVNIPVNFTPQTHGLWERTKGDRMVYRMRIKSLGAEAINLGFTKYNMPRGGKLFLYSSDYKEVFGPFTPADNEEHEQLWTPNITGDEIVIEIQIPKSEQANLDITLGFVNHAFQKFSSAALLSGSCNLDVICGAADGWGIVDPHRDIIQSVAVISTGGGTFCTGFLISNANQDCTPLFMTANHCGINGGNAASLVTYWNFFNSTCRQPNSTASGQNGNGSLADFNTGSIFRATNAASDFCIVELDDPVSETANAYFAGYDASGAQPTSAIGVHHPSTDEKRISFEDDPTEFTTYGGGATDNYTHVRVVDWDTGTTEGGSSGSPLFDQDERIIGQLHGGGAACGNNSSDWYGSLAVSWEGGGTSATRLSDWLDPNDTGTLVNNGYYAGNCNFSVLADPNSQDVCPPTNAVYTLTVSDAFTSNVTLSVSGLPAGLNSSFSSNNVAPGSSVTLTISNTSNATAGNYTFDIDGTDGTNTSTNTLAINILPSAGSAPTYTSPNNGASGQDPFTTLEWNGVTGVDYNIEIATNSSFSNIIETATVTGSSYISTNTGDGLTTYYWRISATSPCGNEPFGAGWSFTTANIQCVSASASNLELAIGPNNNATTTSVLNISDDAIIADVNVIGIDLTHTWINDLDIRLTSPTGQQIQLMEQICDDEDNMLINFDDESASVFTDIPCPPTDGQSYQPFEALSTFNGLNAQGNWTLTITDNANQDGGTLEGWNLQICFEEATVPDLEATAEVTENNECFEEEEGVIVVTATEGTPPYMYSIDGSPFQSDEFFEELGAGTYSVTVIDATGMSATINNLTVTHPADVSATVSVNQDDVTVNPSGGTAPFTFSLDGTNFQIGNTFNNLANGDYTVFIEDFNGCNVEESFMIAVNSVTLSVEITQTMLCFNDNNAIITAIAGGGQVPYTYSITGGGSQNNGTFDNLPAGTYQITVMDNEGFSQMTAPIIINNPAQLSITGNINGNSVTAMGVGGTGVLEYSIDGINYQSSTQFNNLDNGNYTLFVQDANGCIEITTVVIAVNNLVVSAAFERISCFNDANGIIIVSVSGGSTPYSYSLNGGTPQSSNTFANLGPDTYEIIVTDNDGFIQVTNSITLINPDELVLAALVDEDEITAFGNGGTGNLLYSINGFSYQSNNIFSGLTNDIYTVYVQDENGCIATQEVTIAVNTLAVSATSTDIICNEDNNGTITTFASGGMTPYMYSINGLIFQTSEIFDNLGVGTYEITVQDADGFTQVTNTVSISEPSMITVSTNTNANEVTINANGGTPPFQYSIDGTNYQTNNIFSDLANGSYTISIQDANGCIVATTAIVALNSLVVSAQGTGIICNGDNNGTITASAGGGEEPYMYSIDGLNFQTSNIFDNLNAGTYEVTVQDADGFMQVTNTVSISEPTAITASASTNEDVLTVIASGGTSILQYSIDGENFQESNIFIDLTNGTYTVSVQDENACMVTTTATISINSIVITAQSTNITCNGANDGTITTFATGGQEPYMYSIDGENFQASNIFEGIEAGTYEITVQDAAGFTSSFNTISINNPSGISVSASTNNNQIIIDAEGGTGNLEYSIDGENFQASNTFSGLTNGAYTISVRDDNSCLVTTSATISVNSLAIAIEANNITCHDENDGTISAFVGGGQEPYMYSVDGENFQISPIFDNLGEGDYTITVQDAAGLSVTSNTIVIINPEMLTISVVVEDDNIAATGAGGIVDYLFSIDGENYQESSIFNNLTNGTYTVYIVDNNSCTNSTEATILVNTVSGIVSISNQISCFGGTNGAITVTATSGSAPFQYSIDGGMNYQMDNYFGGLAAGEYAFTILDNDGFTFEIEIATLSQPTELQPNSSVTGNTITVMVEGGISPYSYSINGSEFTTDNVFEDLVNGNYDIIIQDFNGCEVFLTEVINVNTMSISLTIENSISCFNVEDGVIIVNVMGGTAPFMYSIDGENFQESNIFIDLAAGAYAFTITDAQGALIETTAVLLINPEQLFLSANTDINSATLSAEGGTGDYLYSVDGETFQNSNTFEDLVNGDYIGYVQDANGCIAEAQFTIMSFALFAVAEVTQNIDCFGGKTGIIEINASGGMAPYTYSINGFVYVANNIFTELAVGTYTCYAQDANGTIYETEIVTVIESEILILNAQSISSTIIASAEGGNAPYQFSIDGDNFQASGTFNDLPDGEYPVTVMDALGCTQTLTIEIDIVGTENLMSVINFIIYPNPNMGTFAIELENEMRGDLNFSLYNVIGQKLFEGIAFKETNLLTYQISDLELPTGSYEVLIKGGDYFGKKKVVVVR